jgi:N-methylhydantoinase A
MTSASSSTFAIGVDVGGTHTDLCVNSDFGRHRAKAFTTHQDYSVGIVDALRVAATEAGLGLEELLRLTSRSVVSTTIVTNAVTELVGARVGVFVTAGFGDTFQILGGFRRNVLDDHEQTNPPQLVARPDVIEVQERVTRDGVVVPLNEGDVRRGVRRLKEAGVDTIAVCLLWSFREPGHEERIRQLIHEEWPEAFVSLSSEVHPVIREHERFTAAVFNAFCQPAAVRLLDTLEARLRSLDYSGPLAYFSGAGGTIGVELARKFPILLLQSGPAGGVIGATNLGKAMGKPSVLSGDMGGTSFDACLIEDGAPTVTHRFEVDKFQTGVSLIEVISIGAGGGSVGHLDERNVPQVGPLSAGSMPGPACYGRGGTRPTVTDAAVTVGLIDPGNYLAGRAQLLPGKSIQAMDSVFKSTYGWSAEQASEGVLELVCTNMSLALRRISVERGHDPRQFQFIAFGGTLPLFATRICEKLGMHELIVPANSSVFSALGTLTANYLRRYSRTVHWKLGVDVGLKQAQDAWADMSARAEKEAATYGLAADQVERRWSADLRFEGQVFEVEVPLPDVLNDQAAERVALEFPKHYEKVYGTGSAWQAADVIAVSLNLTCAGPSAGDYFPVTARGEPTTAVPATARMVFLDSKWTEIPVYRESDLAVGCSFEGPAVADLSDTTLFVAAGWECTRDQYANFVLRFAEGAH